MLNYRQLGQTLRLSSLKIFLCCFLTARERILTNLKKHDAPQSALLLVPMKAPVPDISTGSLSDVHATTSLIQEDLTVLQHQAK